MRFRRLQIKVRCADGNYGTTLDFPDGLVVVWADNSMGKSTCVKAMLVVLGMEAMLGTSQNDLPLPPAMKSVLAGSAGESQVLESEIFLEIENKHGKRIVVQRTVVGARGKNLITVHTGPALTDPTSPSSTSDYFVSQAGAATRTSGFHKYLADFLDWKLPTVQTYDGNEIPLYLQSIFPYFIVEQTRGWSTALPPIPTQFRIRDAHKRATEFLLNMDAHQVALKRQMLAHQAGQLESRWETQARLVQEFAELAGGSVQALPAQPTVDWPPQILPQILVPKDNDWMSLIDRAQANAVRLQAILTDELPRVSEVAQVTQGQLTIVEQEVVAKQALLARLMNTIESEGQEYATVSERLAAIKEDIQRNKDVRTLRNLGSHQHTKADQATCPVCHQDVSDSLIPLPDNQAVMSLDENIEFLQDQQRTFRVVCSNSERSLSARRKQASAIREELGQLRAQSRALRQTLVSDGRLPSIAAIQERLSLEERIEQDKELALQVDGLFDGFSILAKEWRQLRIEIMSLPDTDVTQADKEKIASWTASFRAQLAEYGFGSFGVSEASISVDTYRPEHEGFDLQTSISASDLIRTIWSYLSGLLEVARSSSTNHPGFVLFDEPRQQSTRDVSFASLMKRASYSTNAAQQVIFFTSEDRIRLRQHLAGLPHTLKEIEGRVLARL